MMWVLYSSLFELWVLLWLWLKNMFGEWCSWEMMMCLVLLMMKVLFLVISGILFRQIFCFFMYLMVLVDDLWLQIIRCMVMCSGVLQFMLCWWYLCLLKIGLFSLQLMYFRVVLLLQLVIGKIDFSVVCRLWFVCLVGLMFFCRNL